MGKRTSKDGKTIIANVYDYFAKEYVTRPVREIAEKVSLATKKSKATIFRIKREKKISGTLSSPRKVVNKKNPVTDISEPMKCQIRRIIYDFHKTEKFHVII